MKYKPEFKEEYRKDLKKVRKNQEIIGRLEKKVTEILENPHHYKTLRNVLKNRRRVHIKNFVLIFEIEEENNKIVFHTFKHHDEAYKTAY